MTHINCRPYRQSNLTLTDSKHNIRPYLPYVKLLLLVGGINLILPGVSHANMIIEEGKKSRLTKTQLALLIASAVISAVFLKKGGLDGWDEIDIPFLQ